MRFEDLAARLFSVEAKLATLTGTSVTLNNATSIEELDARLSIVEVHVNQLITVKIQSQIEAIVAAPAADASVAVEAVMKKVMLLATKSVVVNAGRAIVAETPEPLITNPRIASGS